MNITKFLSVIGLSIVLAGCANAEAPVPEDNTVPEEVTEEDTELEENISDVEEKEEQTVGEGEKEKDKPDVAGPEEAADVVVNALQQKDMKTVSTFVHPTKGVRFSPYGYVREDVDKVFTAEEVEGLMEDETVYTWGVFDGKGNPIEKTFADYYERFVYDVDFANPEEKAVNERLGHGNTLDNTDEVYPNATVVEYHFSGFEEQYDGMDWRSLRLVIEEKNDQWYLVGVIHDEWTI
ncbi:hypothetical protein [Bacillus sp. FJAT-45350]|uniref:hypothetical protein n=1 Tax=Bacillus sp. FJAT-45350 TaxID=2011014 RepID=UPI000BB7B8BA|nr:hypothetical protein [Bacillus sp. FJAT-45350]